MSPEIPQRSKDDNKVGKKEYRHKQWNAALIKIHRISNRLSLTH